jgi:hypothetical protein
MRDWSKMDAVYAEYMKTQCPGRGVPNGGKDVMRACDRFMPVIEAGIAGRRVVDVGCGEAFMSTYFVGRGWDYVGFDLYERTDPTVIKGDYHFDGIEPRELLLSSQHLEHSMFPLYSVSRLASFVVPGGYLIINIPECPSLSDCHGHYCVMPDTEWNLIFSDVGLKILDLYHGMYGTCNQSEYLLQK